MYTNGPGTANYLYFLVFKMFQCFLYFKNVTCDLVTYNITSCEELTHWKRPWRWEGLRGRRRRGRQRMKWLDGITDSMDMSLSNSRSWWWTGRPGMLWSMGWQRVGHDWVNELNWTEGLLILYLSPFLAQISQSPWNFLKRWEALKFSLVTVMRWLLDSM